MTPAERRRAYNLRRRYDMSIEEWDQILEFQGGVCPICHLPPKEGQRRFSTDHDHKDRFVRGITCLRCNKYRIGNLTLAEAEAIYAYLSDPPAIRVIGERLVPLSTDTRRKRQPRKRPRKKP